MVVVSDPKEETVSDQAAVVLGTIEKKIVAEARAYAVRSTFEEPIQVGPVEKHTGAYMTTVSEQEGKRRMATITFDKDGKPRMWRLSGPGSI